jgi:hypothetical protein
MLSLASTSQVVKGELRWDNGAGRCMLGQWLGGYTGNTQGVVIVELDDAGDRFEGVAFVYPNDRKFPPLFAPVETPGKDVNLRI